ncbi:monothiol glutaredoxin grx5 [Apiospora kogelbergensis]|uniref:Monothiol glutaredoxin grx5 n=1 Tax=Apiospora kogelbergensis TaxID=1337665 RepID=A0AAW0Q3Y9_9PEZI
MQDVVEISLLRRLPASRPPHGHAVRRRHAPGALPLRLPDPPALRHDAPGHREGRRLGPRRALHEGHPRDPQCGFSRASIQILGLQCVDPNKFAAFNVLEDEELRSGIKEFSDWPTIPQLYVEKEFVGGCDILVSMHQDGSLAKMLEGKGVVAPPEEGESDSK